MFRPPHSLSSVPTCVHSDRFPPRHPGSLPFQGVLSLAQKRPSAHTWCGGLGPRTRASQHRPAGAVREGSRRGDRFSPKLAAGGTGAAQSGTVPRCEGRPAPPLGVARGGCHGDGALPPGRPPRGLCRPGPLPPGPLPPPGASRAAQGPQSRGGGAGIVPEWSRPVHTQERNTASGETVQGTERHTACTCVLECRDRDREDAGETDTGKFAWHVVVRPTSP